MPRIDGLTKQLVPRTGKSIISYPYARTVIFPIPCVVISFLIKYLQME